MHRLRCLGLKAIPVFLVSPLKVDSNGKPGDGWLHGGSLSRTRTSSRIRLFLRNREAPLDMSDRPIVHMCACKTNNKRLQDRVHCWLLESASTLPCDLTGSPIPRLFQSQSQGPSIAVFPAKHSNSVRAQCSSRK